MYFHPLLFLLHLLYLTPFFDSGQSSSGMEYVEWNVQKRKNIVIIIPHYKSGTKPAHAGSVPDLIVFPAKLYNIQID